MIEAAVTHYSTETFPGISVVDSEGNAFFFYDPARMFPFATLVTEDDYDFPRIHLRRKIAVFRPSNPTICGAKSFWRRLRSKGRRETS